MDAFDRLLHVVEKSVRGLGGFGALPESEGVDQAATTDQSVRQQDRSDTLGGKKDLQVVNVEAIFADDKRISGPVRELVPTVRGANGNVGEVVADGLDFAKQVFCFH